MQTTLQNSKKNLFSIFALLLVISISIPVATLQTATAHDPPWTIPSFAYLVAQPEVVGVGQPVTVFMWVDAAMDGAAINNDVRRHDYKLTITKPDGKTDVHQWSVVEDTTGVQYFSFTPDQVGTYDLLFEYPGQVYTWDATAAMRTWTNDTFLPASDSTTVTVQEEPLDTPVLSYPLPTEYWTRPIEGQNTYWYALSSNWLNPPFNRVGDSGTQGATSACDTQGGYGRYQPDGIAPNSPHIMWSKPIQDGGVVGGELYDVLGKTYYMGGSYNVRFTEAIVMHGRLSYLEPWGNSGSGGDYVCVDLRTGEELWRIDATSDDWVGKPVFGYLYSDDNPNQHGVVPNGWLFTLNFARAYDPRTGRASTLNITNVPTGTAVAGPQGEILRYVWNNNGKWLAQWNSSKVFTSQSSGTIDAGTAARYDWNVTISSLGSGRWSINRHIIAGNMLLLEQGSFGGPRTVGTGVNMAAVNLDPSKGAIGQILWKEYYPVAPNNVTRKLIAVDSDAGVFVFQDKETLRLTGFSLANGKQVWTTLPENAKWDTMRSTSLAAYGNLYASGFDGILYCYEMKTGNLLWTYGNGGPGNSTYAGLETNWGYYPIFVDVIADGKVYLGTTEHSPDSPFYKNAHYRCLNATTGEEIWTLTGWGTGMYVGQSDIVADGFFVFLNCYDSQIYCVGKGPSAMNVQAPTTAAKLGESVIIQGTVTDIAAGTEQNEQAARFPNGVPAVSDESMRSWMEYVYMQKPKPTDVTGVTVELFVTDANNNYRSIGTTTTDSNGFYSYQWIPDISGKYVVYAKFAGSESYWPSNAITAFAVDDVEATAAPTESPPLTVEQYFIPAVIGLAVAMIIGFAILILLMLKKKE